MRPILYSTCVQVKDMEEGVRFFTDVLDYETVGPCSDQMDKKTLSEVGKNVMPKLFGFDVAECKFRSQLVAPKGNHATFYNIFEWVNPKWVEADRYDPPNHCGIARSQMLIEGYDDIVKKVKEYDGAEFICPEIRWANAAFSDQEIVFSRAGSIRHNSGAIFQIKQDENDQLSVLPGRGVKINHRAIHCKNIEETLNFYGDTLGLERDTKWNPKVHTHILASTHKYNFSQTYVHYLTEYQLQKFFGYSYKDTPVCDLDAGMMLADSVDRKSAQNLDCFQWIEPKVYGEPYTIANHIGLQRVTFIVDNFGEVKEKMKSRAKKIICDEIKLPEVVMPELEKPCNRAMSVLDPDGVFVLVLGN